MKRQKISRSRRGFTLTETLAAVLILTLLTGVIAMGTSTAAQSYRQLLFTSESDLLASTLNTALGDVLHYATEPEKATASFSNPNYGVNGGHFLNANGKLYLNTANVADDAEGATLLTLVSDGAYTNLKIRDFSIAYADGLFTGGYTIAGGEDALPITFVFRPLNETGERAG